MRILQITSARDFGGGERHLLDLCRELHQRGHEIFVAVRPTNRWQDKLNFLPPENILHVSLRNSFGILSAQRIAEFAREQNIEIVHAHVARDYIPASLACRIAKNAELVLTRHVLFPMKPFHRVILGNAAKVIAVSNAVSVNLKKIFPHEKIALITNGIKIENLSGDQREQMRREFRFLHDIPFDVPLIGIVGELNRLKGQEDFILAAQIVARRFPETRFLIVGKDHTFKKEFRRDLKRLVKIFRLDEQVLFLDWVEEITPLFAALDVLVSASHTESFGLAMLEAMATGTPIVAAATEGAREILTAESGILTPIKSPAKIAEAIIELLGNEEKRQNFAAKGQQRAAENFDLTRMITAVEDCYRQIKAAKISKSD